MKSLTIVISFDVREQVMPRSILALIASLMHEFRFDSAEATFHWRVVPAISLPAHGLDHPGCAEKLAVMSGGVLAAAIRVVNQARRRFLSLDGHSEGRDSQLRPHMLTHRPANDLAGKKIEHDGQIEPSFLGWDIGYVGEPDLIGPPFST
jgi:hypothetical protein